MYQDITKKDEQLAEDYLLGKAIDSKEQAKQDAGQDRFKDKEDIGFGDMEESEAFQRLVEDPLVKIK